MIDVHSLVVMQWDYMAIVADEGMTLAYRVYFMSHPFPQFIDLVGMAILMQAP